MSEKSDSLHEVSERQCADAFKKFDKGKKYEGQRVDDWVADYTLGTSMSTIMRIELSTGGPADWLEVEVTKDYDTWDVDKVTHCSVDWGEGANRTPVREGEGLWKLAEYFAERIA